MQYQWYLSNDGTVNNATLIPGATSASYTIDKSYFTELGDKNFFVKISGLVNGVQLTSINSEIMTLTVSGAPVIKISTQPKEENVSVGQTTNFPTFRVQASTGLNGESLTYQWYSNTENSFDGAQTISSANQNSYTITKDDVGTSGITKKYFFVKIGGSISGINLEEVVSNIVTLTTFPSIKIDTQLKDLAVLIGQINLPTLSIFASSENPNVIVKYQWYSNDKNSIDGAIELSGEESTSYKIKSGDVQEPGIKYFFVKISGTIDGFDLVPVYSNISALNVKSLDSAIQITIQPENQEGILRQTENLPTFTVQATTGFENENLTYQWYQNAVVSTQNGFPISGEINPSFTPSKKYF